MKIFIIKLGILSFILMASSLPTKADGAGYRMCNKTGQAIAVSYIYRDGLGIFSDSWRWNGFFIMQNGQCGYIMPTHSAMEAYFNFKEVTSSGRAGADINIGQRNFRSSNRSAESASRQYCTYSNNSGSKKLEAHGTCSSTKTSLYSLFWQGLGQKHNEVRDYPHTLTIN